MEVGQVHHAQTPEPKYFQLSLVLNERVSSSLVDGPLQFLGLVDYLCSNPHEAFLDAEFLLLLLLLAEFFSRDDPIGHAIDSAVQKISLSFRLVHFTLELRESPGR